MLAVIPSHFWCNVILWGLKTRVGREDRPPDWSNAFFMDYSDSICRTSYRAPRSRVRGQVKYPTWQVTSKSNAGKWLNIVVLLIEGQSNSDTVLFGQSLFISRLSSCVTALNCFQVHNSTWLTNHFACKLAVCQGLGESTTSCDVHMFFSNITAVAAMVIHSTVMALYQFWGPVKPVDRMYHPIYEFSDPVITCYNQ